MFFFLGVAYFERHPDISFDIGGPFLLEHLESEISRKSMHKIAIAII